MWDTEGVAENSTFGNMCSFFRNKVRIRQKVRYREYFRGHGNSTSIVKDIPKNVLAKAYEWIPDKMSDVSAILTAGKSGVIQVHIRRVKEHDL